MATKRAGRVEPHRTPATSVVDVDDFSRLRAAGSSSTRVLPIAFHARILRIATVLRIYDSVARSSCATRYLYNLFIIRAPFQNCRVVTLGIGAIDAYRDVT